MKKWSYSFVDIELERLSDKICKTIDARLILTLNKEKHSQYPVAHCEVQELFSSTEKKISIKKECHRKVFLLNFYYVMFKRKVKNIIHKTICKVEKQESHHLQLEHSKEPQFMSAPANLSINDRYASHAGAQHLSFRFILLPP